MPYSDQTTHDYIYDLNAKIEDLELALSNEQTRADCAVDDAESYKEQLNTTLDRVNELEGMVGEGRLRLGVLAADVLQLANSITQEDMLLTPINALTILYNIKQLAKEAQKEITL